MRLDAHHYLIRCQPQSLILYKTTVDWEGNQFQFVYEYRHVDCYQCIGVINGMDCRVSAVFTPTYSTFVYFIFVYFIFMSLIVLYFLHSTSVLSFYMDVVLTLSICSIAYVMRYLQKGKGELKEAKWNEEYNCIAVVDRLTPNAALNQITKTRYYSNILKGFRVMSGVMKIECVPSFKYLGVYMDEILHWCEHVN